MAPVLAFYAALVVFLVILCLFFPRITADQFSLALFIFFLILFIVWGFWGAPRYGEPYPDLWDDCVGPPSCIRSPAASAWK